MLIMFSQGKIITNNREIIVKLEGDANVTLQAQVDEIALIAVGSRINRSIHLDNSEQLAVLLYQTGIAIEHR